MIFDVIFWLLNNIIFSKWTLLLGILFYAAYKWSIATYDLFEKRGMKYLPPVPFLGSFGDMFLQKVSFGEGVKNLYVQLPNEKICGVFELRKPIFMLRDPELIKQICIKDFDHFLDRRPNIDEKQEPLFAKNLAFLHGQRWRDMRSTLSPVFTGSKIRIMFQLVSECGSNTVNHLEKEVKSNNGKPLTTDLKDLFSRFTTDVIATCAFGLQTDSFGDKNNEFYLMGKKSLDFEGIRNLLFLICFVFPKVAKFFDLHIFPESLSNFFRKLVWDTIRYREKENIVRPDLINLLIQARKGKLKSEPEENGKGDFAAVEETKVGEAIHQSKLEEDDVTAQCLSFFFAGFDTSSTCMSFTAHELAVNPDVQKKLIEEVDATYEKVGGKALTYEALQDMRYLDMVISESLRFWPPAVAADRKCVKPYTLNLDGKNYRIETEEGIMIPIIGLHYDPQYFPNPTKFDPERFSDENKHNIVPFSYLPFGVGPRNCIGSRFALMETKAIIYYILTKFTFEVSEKTQIPLKLKNGGFSIKPEKGFWLDLKLRTK